MRKFNIYLLGLKDSLGPQGLTMGMTYSDPLLCEAYDRGANMGEALGGMFWPRCRKLGSRFAAVRRYLP